MHAVRGELAIFPMKGLHWDADKLQDQIFEGILHLRHRCEGSYSRRVLLSDRSLWNLMIIGTEPSSLVGPFVGCPSQSDRVFPLSTSRGCV